MGFIDTLTCDELKLPSRDKVMMYAVLVVLSIIVDENERVISECEYS